MKKIKLLVLSLILIFTTIGCTSGKIESINYSKYEEMLNNKNTFAIEIMSSNCPHCESLKPKLTTVVKENNINLKQLDVSKLTDDEKKSLREHIGALSTPQIIFYINGEEQSTKTRIVGDVSKDKLIEKFKENDYID